MKKAQRLTEVLAAVPWPGSHSTGFAHAVTLKIAAPKVQGEMRFLLGVPRLPDHTWTCDTDLVWPVHGINGEIISRDECERLPFACRHQIVAGD